MRTRDRLDSPITGVPASVAVVALVTGVIALIEPYVPTLSLGALYVFAVLPVAVIWGLGHAVAVSIASMLAFNWFFLDPVHTFTLNDSSNWFALVVYVVTAVVVSELAARSRRRAKEAALLARIASSLLEQGGVADDMAEIESSAATALRVERARIDLTPESTAAAGEIGRPLEAGGRRVGTVYLRREGRGNAAARRRVLAPLASMLAVAIDRERLAQEAVEAEALRHSDMVKTAVLRAVSHDLRSPLMAISTYAETLARFGDTLDDADRKGLLDAILLESARLDHLVGDLLDLSRLQAGALESRRRPCPADDLVGRAVKVIGEGMERVEIVPNGDSAWVSADPGQIERVLVNLIENALKYSPTDAPVRITTALDGDDVVIRIDDAGPGLTRGELERVFEPFERGAASSRVRGAGLGLAIARGFAEANGGRVWASTREGGGSSFALALPAAVSPTLVTA
jgi:two-component system sensor histidine kinase KdpD